ncbi:HlyD family type I secretion periplasmic adaptor subunit [Parashewanella curva]|uniref:Membrane fusion protein (MFP) family protein n=1 Tax=Parashewanella curva TaxID=2338552 RepID=A0A3L8PVQ8_9GAMM|nr:HlyD family type I secretion periplasmic adaptor subunit [Parashewanella curva]RLV59495.1 HlyD family type I secretion periplasmic adaptor subunit [Parashewanella curva]
MKLIWKKLLSKRSKKINYDFLPVYLEIEKNPVSPWARRTALVLTGFIVISLLWSIFGKLDIHASATGKVLISSHSKVIQSLQKGEIIEINVKDGQLVNKGDVLIKLNPITLNTDYQKLKKQVEFYLLEEARLKALLTTDPTLNFVAPEGVAKAARSTTLAFLKSQFNEYQSMLKSINAEIEVTEQELAANKTDLRSLNNLKQNISSRVEASKMLASSQAISRVEFLEREKELLETERAISGITSQLKVLTAKKSSLTQQKQNLSAQKQREYYEQLGQIQINLSQAKQELIKAKEHHRATSIISPVDGVVQQLTVHTLGGVVTEAQALMVIVPQNQHLEAEVKVLNKDVGFVVSGQSVETKIDSFPYTKYGTIKGKVLYVSKDAVEDEKLGLVFPTRIQLDANKILIDDNWTSLAPGMSVTTEIKTGERRVIEYLLSPLKKYQSEAIRER